MEVQIMEASVVHVGYAPRICEMMEIAAKERGTGIAKREPTYIQNKMLEGKAVIALRADEVVGFCYIESWGHGKYVANSGLVVHSEMRKTGLARTIKKKIFELSRKKYPDAKIFGITTSLAVMKINSDLGYRPVTFSELTTDEQFWKGCASCKNYDILNRTQRAHCLCTGMLFDPEKHAPAVNQPVEKEKRWQRFLKFFQLKSFKIKKIAEPV